MPNTQALIGSQGATFRRAYASYPLCCPSRATLLSGQYMHNHGIRGNLPPFGGWENFKPHEPDALPVWTEDSGYYNIQIGKYMNGYGPTASDPAPVPDGLGRVVREGLRALRLLQLQPARKDRAERRPRGEVLRRRPERLPDRRLGAEGQGIHRRPRRLTGAVHDEPLVQRPPRPVRAGSSPPIHPRGHRPPEGAGLQREEHLRQAKVAAEAGPQKVRQGPEADDHQRAAPASGAAALGRRGGSEALRFAHRGGDPRRHLRHLRLRQRLLPRRAPDRRRQVPAV